MKLWKLNYIKKNSLKLEYILLTHGHGDHIGEVKYIKAQTGAKVVAHSEEQELLLDKKKNL
ncbi:MAG: MBL fold metallo-hydrolase, partial [Romboutsia sp.]